MPNPPIPPLPVIPPVDQPINQTLLNQQASVGLHSPLAITGAFIYIIRGIFSPDNKLSWTWVDNKTESTILVESQYQPDVDAKDLRPGVYVDVDQTSFGQISTGYQDQNQPGLIETGQETFISHGNVDVLIDCTSKSKGESIQLGTLVSTYLHCSAKLIKKTFGFRSMSPVAMGRCIPYYRQENLFNSQITFRVEFELRYATIPIAPVLRGIGVNFSTTGEDMETVLRDISLKSLTEP